MNRIETLLAYLKTDPQDSFVRHALALEYAKLGKLENAIQWLKELLRDQPDYLGSYYQLGKFLEQCGEFDEAMQTYEAGMQVARNLNDTKTLSELQHAYDELL